MPATYFDSREAAIHEHAEEEEQEKEQEQEQAQAQEGGQNSRWAVSIVTVLERGAAGVFLILMHGYYE